MKIAIQTADLDAERIDGTRVYILNLLKYFGQLDKKSIFWLYHKNNFNSELTPPNFPNYKVKRIKTWFFGTQIGLCWRINKDRPDVLWMPMHNAPFFLKKDIKIFVTIHDLAFKYFPQHFTKRDLRKLNLLAKLAIHKSHKIIAISESTKKDILKFYPEIPEEKVKVIYHGFDRTLFQKSKNFIKDGLVQKKFKIKKDYIIYVGAIQPRKNLKVLIEAFNLLKSDKKIKSMMQDRQLVFAGEKAWLYEEILKEKEKSPYKNDILITGKIDFSAMSQLLEGASVFVYPSLYEGFGIPVLEAMASQVPVIVAKNSSLVEVGGEAVSYFKTEKSDDLYQKIKEILTNKELAEKMRKKGLRQVEKFSWEKCARETLNYFKS